MNMKKMKKMKKFFTLSRRAEGFTLVELIVVIAILAILGGVAVPAYSGYVKKANMQADMTLISEIEHALTLAGYSGTFAEGEGGYLILSADGAVQGVEAGSNLEKALIATFGTNYSDTLKLKYDSWGSNGVFNNLTAEDAEAVYLSSYMNGGRSDMLLEDVEKLTAMTKNLVSAITGDAVASNKTLSELFGADLLNSTAAKYGIGNENWTEEDWDAWHADLDNQAAYGNLLVLAAAEEVEMKKVAQANGETYEMSYAGDMIDKFSGYYGFAASNPEFSETLTSYMDDLDNVGSAEEGADWYRGLEAAAKEAGYDSYAAEDQGEIDRGAFSAIMAALGNPTAEQAGNIAADLNNANLFTNGVVNGMYNDYLTAVDAMVAPALAGGSMLDISFGEGEVLIVFATTGGALRVANSCPTTK